MEPFISYIDFEVPKTKNNLFKEKNFKKIFDKTGILETYKINKNLSVIDLALKVCIRNLDELKNCDTLIFVTQTPEY